MKSFTHQELLSRVEYNPITGEFKRIIKSASSKPGDRIDSIWSSSVKNYRRVCVFSDRYFAHRLAWFYVHEYWPDEVDHINGDGTDNRLCNLREVSHSENMRNMRKHSSNTSGVTGVHWWRTRGCWAVRIYKNNKPIHVGYFSDFNDAVVARKNAEMQYGYHDNHGTERDL